MNYQDAINALKIYQLIKNNLSISYYKFDHSNANNAS